MDTLNLRTRDRESAAKRALILAQRQHWPEGYVAMCLAVKDQRRDLRQWIEYYRWIGVRKFYVFDHNSTKPLAPMLSDYLRAGIVEYQYFAGRHRLKPAFSDTNQYRAYLSCILQHRRRHRWLGFLDADEFLVFGQDSGLADINVALAEYEQHGGLAVNWMLFGSSGHERRPEQIALEAYTKCMPRNSSDSTHVKVFANTAYLALMGGTPHDVILRKGSPPVVNVDHEPVDGPKTRNATWNKMALHHYVLKSAADFAEKMTRGSGAGNHKDWNFFLDVEAAATDNCTYGQRVAREFLAAGPRLHLHGRRREQEQAREDAAVARALQQRQLVMQQRQEERQRQEAQQEKEEERRPQEAQQETAGKWQEKQEGLGQQDVGQHVVQPQQQGQARTLH